MWMVRKCARMGVVPLPPPVGYGGIDFLALSLFVGKS